jgi:hypothetical protein
MFKSILARSVFFILVIFVACAPPAKYSHYSNHKKSVHRKSPGVSLKPHSKNTVAAPAAKSSSSLQTKKTTVEPPATSAKDHMTMIGAAYKTRRISKDSLSRIHAVLVSADVDGPQGAGTKNYIEGMTATSKYLKDAGVHVTEFFCPTDDWAKIKAAAANAHILVYSGHGVYNGSIPPTWVGGFSLTGSFVSSKQIQEELKMAKNAIVVFNHACFTAGSAAGDPLITQDEAHRRVSIYSHPFMDLGFASYYANNFYGLNDYFDGLFAGNYANDVYIKTASSWSLILELKAYEYRTDSEIGISRYGTKDYDVAFVGRKDFTVLEWLKK